MAKRAPVYTLKSRPLTGGSQANLRYPVAQRPRPKPPVVAPGVPAAPPTRYEFEPGWGGITDYQDLLRNQFDYAEAERAMANANAADEAAIAASVGRGQADLGRFMGELGEALRTTRIGDVSALAGRGSEYSGAVAGLEEARQKDYQRQSTAASQSLADQIAQLQTGLAGRKEQRAANFRAESQGILSRLAQDPRYQPREPVVGTFAGAASFSDPRAAWNALNQSSVRDQNASIISRGYDDFVRRYGGRFTGAAPAAPAAGGGANPADITGYEWRNGVQYAVMRDGRRLPSSTFGARF